MSTSLRLWLWPVLLWLPLVTLAQSPSHSFQELTMEDGLPHNNVHEVLQDQQGFMWFTSSGGLVRYDGRELRAFRHNPDDSLSISNDFTGAIYEDQQGYIWIGTTGGGLNRYTPSLESFTAFRHDPNNSNSLPSNNVQCILEDDIGHLWVGTEKGLTRITLSSEPDRRPIFYEHIRAGPNGLSNSFIKTLFQDKDRYIWVGTNDGLNRLPPPIKGEESPQRNILQFNYQRTGESTIHGTIIHTLFQAKDGSIWVGTGNSLEKLMIAPDGRLAFKSVLPSPWNEQTVLDIEQTDQQSFWVSILNKGLLHFDYTDGIFTVIEELTPRPQQVDGLKADLIYEIYADRNGLYWLATEHKGIIFFDPKSQPFAFIPFEGGCISILEDQEGWLWMGGYGKGLRSINSTGDTMNYTAGYPNFYSNLVTIIEEDSSGNVWFGSFRGLNLWAKSDRVEDSTLRLRHYRAKPNTDQGLSERRIFAFHEYPKGVYWIGTRGGGLNRLTFPSGNWEQPHFLHYQHQTEQSNSLGNNYVWSITHDKAGHLWVGTDQGVIKITLNEKFEATSFLSFENEVGEVNSLSLNLVGPLHCTVDSIVWAGTSGGGLNKLDFRQDPSFTQPLISRYNTNDGLNNNYVYGMLEDQQHNLWLSTNRGLARFDPNFSPIAGQQTQDAFINFYARDGIQGDEFSTNAYDISPATNRFYFGGENGVSVFHPDSLDFGSEPPALVFTDLRIFNESVPVGQAGSPLSLAIGQTSSFELDYQADMISFTFAALDFLQSPQNQYAYRLEGYNNQWIYIGNENTVHFTNLDPGDYQLHIKGSNSRGTWNHKGTSIAFTIHPPPWRSWWAYTLYVILFVAVLYSFIQYRVQARVQEMEAANQLTQARFEERERLRKQNAADYHDELGHRLTKISLFLELAERQSSADRNLKSYLAKVKSNTQDLSDGIRDLIWSLDPAKDSLYETLLRLQAFGDILFDFSDTAFQTTGISEDFEQIQLGADQRRHILLLFKEAMNNCLKYAQADLAKLTIKKIDDKVLIIFQDDGKGFEVSGEGNGYGLKNMEDRAKKIGGVLLISSIKDRGTKISLELPDFRPNSMAV
ncbi:MAG: hypothetical protein KTR30_25250 [Saprospiraceae bacterium]|nr:hypothetical protein [Saprospiraceae bacterium]